MSKKYEKFLIVGATGGTGKELVNLLLNQNKQVGILIRNKTKSKQTFKENYEKIEKIVEYELGNINTDNTEIKYNNDLIDALDWCDAVISVIGPTLGVDLQKTDYFTTVELLNHCEKTKDKFKSKTFVYMTSISITRPYSPVSIVLNYIFPFLMGWKALAENRIRQSGVNYLIVRPGRLTYEKTPKAVAVYQGDRVNFRPISRLNVSRTILNALENVDINKGQVTIEIIENTNTNNEIEIKCGRIKNDDEESLIKSDHFKSNKIITVLFNTLFLLFALYILCKFK